MLLQDKVTVIYGGSGAIGSQCARVFAREGAMVFLAARHPDRLAAVVRDIEAAGGKAYAHPVDTLIEHDVERHVAEVLDRAGRIDVALNAVGMVHVQGPGLLELSLADFELPIASYTRSNFLTARAVARAMVRQRVGVVLTLSTPGSRLAGTGFLGFGMANAAVETLTRHLAAELGPHGARAICLRPDAIPQALAQGSHAAEVFAESARRAGQPIATMLAAHAESGTLLKRLPTLAEVAEFAAFVASDRASAMTGAIVNLTCGSLVD